MTVNSVTGIENIDIAKWEGFVKGHPAGNVFQMPAMHSVFLATYNYKPYVVACFNDRGDVKGIMQGVRICNGKGVFCKMSARVVVWGGPLADDDDPECLSLLFNAFNELVKKDAVYCEIRNLTVLSERKKQLFDSLGYSYFPYLNILVDLRKSEEYLLKQLEPAKRRNVKKGVREGLKFGEIKNEEELAEAYGILENVYRKTEVPLSDISLFRSLFKEMGKNGTCRFFKVEAGGKMAAVMVVLVNNASMYEWYVGAEAEFYSKRPNEFLVWNVMLAAKRKGLQFFDFGGAGRPDREYGVRNFKKGFGGEIIETGRFRKVFKKLPWLLGNAAIRLKRGIKF